MTTNIYETVGALVTWKSSGGTGTVSLASVANGAGRQGTEVDMGAFPRPTWYRWFMTLKAQATPVIGQTLDIYHSYSNNDTSGQEYDAGNYITGSPATDSAFATQNGLLNLRPVGSVVCDNVSGATIMSTSGLVYIPYRYVVPIFWNGLGSALSATGTDFLYQLTPVNPQSQ